MITYHNRLLIIRVLHTIFRSKFHNLCKYYYTGGKLNQLCTTSCSRSPISTRKLHSNRAHQQLITLGPVGKKVRHSPSNTISRLSPVSLMRSSSPTGSACSQASAGLDFEPVTTKYARQLISDIFKPYLYLKTDAVMPQIFCNGRTVVVIKESVIAKV